MVFLQAGSLCLLWSRGCIYDPPVAEGTPLYKGYAKTVTLTNSMKSRGTALQRPSFTTAPQAG